MSKKINVLVPVARYMEPQTESCLRELEMQGMAVRRLYGFAAVDQARNHLVAEALADDCDELLWIDSDMVFRPQDVEYIRGLNLPIVAGCVAQKNVRAFCIHFLPNTAEIRTGEAGGPIEVLYAGMGFMYTKREVYDTIRAKLKLPTCNQRWDRPIVPYFLPMVVPDGEKRRWYLGEDFSFCERARRAGYSIMADTSIRLFHLGNYPYGWEEAGQEPQRHNAYLFKFNLDADQAETEQPALSGRLPGDGAGTPQPA